MCVVSMITDHYRDKWPLPLPQSPVVPSIPYEQFPWAEYWELKRKAEEYDRRTNQPNCEKEDIKKWESEMERFLKEKGILKD